MGFTIPVHLHIYAAEQHVPPVAAIHNGLHLPVFTGNHHNRDAIAGYAVRRAKWRGHKLNRQNGQERYDRLVDGAVTLFNLSGLYPAWDPLRRHPNVTD